MLFRGEDGDFPKWDGQVKEMKQRTEPVKEKGERSR